MRRPTSQIEDALRRATEALDSAWRRGELTPQAIAAAVARHRARHPYRSRARGSIDEARDEALR